MGKLSEQLKVYLESEEGKTRLQQEKAHMAHVESINEKYIEKFHSMSNEEKIAFLYKLKEKYDSAEYYKRFNDDNMGHYKSLYRLLWAYAEKYCVEVIPPFEKSTYCFYRKYDLLGVFILEEIDELFSVDYQLHEVGDVVVPHKFSRKEYVVKRFGVPMFITDSEETLADVVAQVFEKHLEGYTYTVNGEEYRINVDGTVKFIKGN